MSPEWSALHPLPITLAIGPEKFTEVCLDGAATEGTSIPTIGVPSSTP
jgi:hypothetical protein